MTGEDILFERRQAVKRGGEDYAEHYVEGLKDGYKVGTSEINCPFCGQQDFDKSGLKYHLNVYCDEYMNTQNLINI